MSLCNVFTVVRSQVPEGSRPSVISTTSIVLMVVEVEMISTSTEADSVTEGAVIPVRLGTTKSTNSEILRQIRCWLHDLLLLFHVLTNQSQ